MKKYFALPTPHKLTHSLKRHDARGECCLFLLHHLNNPSSIRKKLEELRSLGVSITMDDFGTGYSSLSYLKDFPVGKVKIDKSFINNAISDPQYLAIIKTIISMGHTLGLKVCAEGIETEEQKTLLSQSGCDLGQGFYICHPLSSKDMSIWLAQHVKQL